MATGKRLVFHVIAIIHHVITLLVLNSIDFRATNSLVVKQVFDFSYRYFTIWTFVFQLIFLVCALVCDIGDIKPDLAELVWPKHALLQRCANLRDFMFHTIIFPCTGHTVIGFWTIYFYDRELVLPTEMDNYVHPLINHAVHTNIALVILLEIVLGNNKYPKANLWERMFWLGALIVVYYFMMFWTYFYSGRWIYKFIEVFSTWTERFLFFGLGVISLYLMFFLGVHAQELITQYDIIKKSTKEHKRGREKNTWEYQNVFNTLFSDFKVLKKRFQ